MQNINRLWVLFNFENGLIMCITKNDNYYCQTTIYVVSDKIITMLIS